MFHLVYAFKIIVKNTFQIDKSIEVYLCTKYKKCDFIQQSIRLRMTYKH